MSIKKTPQANTILFTWFNQYAGVILKTPSKTLVIDPVDIKTKKLQTVDAIRITHEHYDHLDPRWQLKYGGNRSYDVGFEPKRIR